MREDLEAITQAIPELAKAEFEEPVRKQRIYGKKHVGRIGGGIVYPPYDDRAKVVARAGDLVLEIMRYEAYPERIEAAGIERYEGRRHFDAKIAFYYKGQKLEPAPALKECRDIVDKLVEGMRLVDEALKRPAKPEEIVQFKKAEAWIEE